MNTSDFIVGKLAYVNFPDGINNQVLGLVQDADGQLSIQWVNIANGEVNPGTDTEDPWNVTENVTAESIDYVFHGEVGQRFCKKFWY